MEVLLNIEHSFSFILSADRDNPSTDVPGSFENTTQRFPKELLLSCATIYAVESLHWHDCALYGVKSFRHHADTSISITYRHTPRRTTPLPQTNNIMEAGNKFN